MGEPDSIRRCGVLSLFTHIVMSVFGFPILCPSSSTVMTHGCTRTSLCVLRNVSYDATKTQLPLTALPIESRRSSLCGLCKLCTSRGPYHLRSSFCHWATNVAGQMIKTPPGSGSPGGSMTVFLIFIACNKPEQCNEAR